MHPTPGERPPKVPWRSLLLVTLCTVLAYGVFAALADARKVADAVRGYETAWFLPTLALVVGGYVLRAFRWHLYLRHAGVHGAFHASLLTFVAGFALGVTPGKVGELVKIYYARMYAGAPYAISFAAVVAERLLDLVALLLLAAIGLGVFPDLRLATAILAVLTLTGVVLLRTPALALPTLRAFGRVHVLRKPVRWLEDVYGRLQPLLSGGLLWVGLALGLASWSLEVAAVWLIAHSLGLELSFIAGAFVFCAGSLAGVLTFLPGGVGATEGGMVGLLLLLGVAAAPATALTLLVRLFTLWFSVLLGGASILALRCLPRVEPTGTSEPPTAERGTA